MSKNTNKIAKALNEKGYALKHAEWTPISGAPIMCGPEGGWFIEYATQQDMDENGFEDAYEGVILAYSTLEALEDIAKLPELKSKDGAENEK